MRIPSEIQKEISGEVAVIATNPDYTFMQITLGGRNTGTVTVTARPILPTNDPDSFQDDEFEHVELGVINLADNPRKRTITIERRRVSALKLVDSGEGEYSFYAQSWGLVTN